MNTYLTIKALHVISATVLFGTGIGTAFFMLRAWLEGDPGILRSTTRSVVLADWIFTTPAVIVQLITGLWLTNQLAIPWNSVWFMVTITLFILVGACWLPVVWIQIEIRNRISRDTAVDECRSLMRLWIALGVPAFTAVLVLFWLMVSRPWTDRLLFATQ